MALSPSSGSDVAPKSFTKLQFLAMVQEEVRAGKRTRDRALSIITLLNPTKSDADGRQVGLHTQLARARFADDGTPNRVVMGTPPQRHSWKLADRSHEPIRKGSQGWIRAKRDAGGENLACGDNDDDNDGDEDNDDDDDDDDDDAKQGPQISWGFMDRGRDRHQHLAARSRCASGSPSPLSSSWSVARDDSAAVPRVREEAKIEIERLEREECKDIAKLAPLIRIFGSQGRARKVQEKWRAIDRARCMF